MRNRDLKKRILDISYKKKLAHIGSCLTAVDIIDDIFAQKKPEDVFVLSSGHAGLAYYVVLEKYNHPEYGKSAEEIFEHHGVHPDRCEACGITVSSGSLGQGLPIALGMAIGLQQQAEEDMSEVYCLLSDGECAEGSVYEALNLANKLDIQNLHVYINANGYGAYDPVSTDELENRLSPYIYSSIDVQIFRTEFEFPMIAGQEAHYKVLSKQEYEKTLQYAK